jgi:uncharacterized protein YegP (UPF0339 family)
MIDVSFPCYKQFKDNRGQWYWIYYARNGEAIARSSESYINRTDCTNSINLVQNSSSANVYFYN